MTRKEIDPASGIETTGHEWDGLKELNNPLPKWWLYTFYATILWSIGYTIAYPAWPMISDATKGVLGYSSRAEVASALRAADQDKAPFRDRIAAMDVTEVAADEDLAEFARAAGKATFANFCSQCHGAGAQGFKGYPTLIDDDWLWGGTLPDIAYTIRHGIRVADSGDTRFSEMPAFGRDQILDKGQVAAVVEHVLALSGQQHEAAKATEGAAIYADNCAACHGETGKGDIAQGAPNLTDGIWLYGGDRATLIQTVHGSRRGMMPAWGERLSDAQIKEVAIYVHSLGGGK